MTDKSTVLPESEDPTPTQDKDKEIAETVATDLHNSLPNDSLNSGFPS